MERHTYFLPRYDDGGRIANEGHALATEAGIPHLLRRTYRHPASPAGDGDYDFLTYFECDDAHVATFHQVCAALRDLKRNPEWRFVREGPTWQDWPGVWVNELHGDYLAYERLAEARARAAIRRSG